MAWDMIRGASEVSAHGFPLPAGEPGRCLSGTKSSRRSESRSATNNPMAFSSRRISVLGIGNVLLADEGVGVRVIETLRDFFEFSENVRLMVNWTPGSGLLDLLTRTDALIVVGAFRTGGLPGTICRLADNDLRRILTGSAATHERELTEALAVAEILGKHPETVILGIEPDDTGNWSTSLTVTVERRIPDLVDATLREVVRLGGDFGTTRIRETSAIRCEAVLV